MPARCSGLRGFAGLLGTLSLLLPGHVAFAATTLKLWHGETTEIRLPNQTLVNPYQGGAETFKEIVERESDGEYLIDIFAGSLYQGEREGIEALMLGAVDFVVTASAPLGAWEPTVMVFDLPFMYADIDSARALLDGEIGREVMANLEQHGIKGLALADNTYRTLETTNVVVTTPEQLQGLKIRVMQSPLYIELFKALGASATPMSHTEVYTSLQTGVIDGYEHPIYPYIASKNFEVAKNVSWTNHTLTVVPYLASMKTWETLSPRVRDIMIKAAVAGMEAHRAYVDEVNAVGIEYLESQGVTFHKVDNIGDFKARMDAVYEIFEEDIGTDLIERVKNY
jgi:tripartite ATP-independent transporter DctP family solute receptor